MASVLPPLCLYPLVKLKLEVLLSRRPANGGVREMPDFPGLLVSPKRPPEPARDRLRVLYTTYQNQPGLTRKQAAILAEAFCVLFSRTLRDDVTNATVEDLEAAFEIRNPRPENTPAAINSGIILEFPRA